MAARRTADRDHRDSNPDCSPVRREVLLATTWQGTVESAPLRASDTDQGEVTNASTEQFLSKFMDAFADFINRVLSVSPGSG